MRINKEKIVEELSLVPFGSKGWMHSEQTRCPVCNKSDKFGILFVNGGAVTHCFYECGDNLSIFRYLKEIGRTDLLIYEQEISLNNTLKPLKKQRTEIEDLPEIDLPKGYKRIYYDKYLSDRNFKSHQYEEFEVGITDHFLEKRLYDKLIFVIRQRGKIVAWLSRSKKSKEWHKKNLERTKQGSEKLVLRYENSKNTDFDRILGGFDQITDNTHTVIAVEGLFDYTNISNLLETDKYEELKAVFTFGNSFSQHQIDLLRTTKVKKVILMYDPGTIRQSKQYSMELSKWFEVEVCVIDDENTDPGNIIKKELLRTLESSKNIYYFYTSFLSKTLKS